MRPPINSVKHYIQHTVTQVTTATVTTLRDVHAVPIQSVDTPSEVAEGSVVKAVYIELWLAGTFNIGSFVLIVEKSPAGNPDPSFTEMTTLNSYENKKNILYTTQGLIPEDNQNPIPVLRQWIKIPKGKQRFGNQDKLKINIAAIGAEDVQFCGFTLYKAYT